MTFTYRINTSATRSERELRIWLSFKIISLFFNRETVLTTSLFKDDYYFLLHLPMVLCTVIFRRWLSPLVLFNRKTIFTGFDCIYK